MDASVPEPAPKSLITPAEPPDLKEAEIGTWGVHKAAELACSEIWDADAAQRSSNSHLIHLPQ